MSGGATLRDVEATRNSDSVKNGTAKVHRDRELNALLIEQRVGHGLSTISWNLRVASPFSLSLSLSLALGGSSRFSGYPLARALRLFQF